MITIVYCHPYDKSLNHTILNEVIRKLADNGRDYTVINLYDDKFDPVLGVNELALYSSGKTDDELTRQYQKTLTETEQLIYIFPVWWGMMPAMLKGFIDKTFLKGTIYDTLPEGGIVPCIDINHTTLITTSQQESAVIAPFIEGYFIPQVLEAVGMNNVTWHNCPRTSTGDNAHRQAFIDEILEDLM